jgi:hypothetical protein
MRRRVVKLGRSVAGLVAACAMLIGGAAAECCAQTPCGAGWLDGNHGSGTDIGLYSSLATANGDLIVGGGWRFGGQEMRQIARLTGNGWTRFGARPDDGVSSHVYTMLELPNGNIIAGGIFTATGSQSGPTPSPTGGLARWDGTMWRSMGVLPSGNGSPVIRALALLQNGDVVAAGDFSQIGGVGAVGIARWNGASWTTLCGGTAGGGAVAALAVLPNGDLLAGGTLRTICGVAANRVARWNGSGWSPMGDGLPGTTAVVRSITVLPDGSVVVGGAGFRFTNDRTDTFARWNGSAWEPLPGGTGGLGNVIALHALPGGELIAVGDTFANNATTSAVCRWTNGSWTRVGLAGTSPTTSETIIRTLSVRSNGDVFVGGRFGSINGVPLEGMAIFDGQKWKPADRGLSIPPRCVEVLANGEVLIGTDETSTNGSARTGLHRGDGVNFKPFSAQAPSELGPRSVRVILPLRNGDLYAAGSLGSLTAPDTTYQTGRWDGSRWVRMPSPPIGSITSLVELLNGHIIAATTSTLGRGFTAGWNGTDWYALGTDVDGPVRTLAVMPNGDLVAGGDFNNAGGSPASKLARWDGQQWHPMGVVAQSAPNASAFVASAQITQSGDLVVYGSFSSIDGRPFANCARLTPLGWQAAGLAVTLPGSLAGLAALDQDQLASFKAFSTTYELNWQSSRFTLGAVAERYSEPGYEPIFRGPLADGSITVSGPLCASAANRPTFFARLNSGLSPAELNLPPRQVKVWPGEATSLNVPSERNGPVTCIWRKGGVPIDAAITPSANTSRLELPRITAGDLGSYDCIIADACGTFVSSTFIVSLRSGCSPADVAGRQPVGGDGTVDGTDFIAFFNSFAAGDVLSDPTADIAGAGNDGTDPDGMIDATDMIVFINAFSVGC